MASLFWASTSKFDEDVDRATAETLPSGGEDLELNFEVSDCIRSKTVAAKDAMRTIKRRINHKNPNVQLLALSLTDTCIKNSGDHFLVEIASREFMDNLVSLIKAPGVNGEVKQKVLRLIQNWALALESKPSLRYPIEVYKLLQKEGFNFPPKDVAVTSAAMVDTLTPPEWIDSDVCMRCRTPFSFTNRKHHCRSCGQVFDQQCTSKVLPLPHLGIMQPVRVCDSCHIRITKTKTTPAGDSIGPSQHSRKVSHSGITRHKSARELADEELQRAIQLSLEEAGLEHGPRRANFVPEASLPPSEPPLIEAQSVDAGEDDPDLRAAIEASLREANAPKPSAPVVEPPVTHDLLTPTRRGSSVSLLPNFDLGPSESDAIMIFSQTVESAASQGGSELVRHRGIGELYETANTMRPKLTRSLDDTQRKEHMLAEMNDKLSQAAKLYDHLLTVQVTNPSRFYTPPPTQPLQSISPIQTPPLPPVQHQRIGTAPSHWGVLDTTHRPFSEEPVSYLPYSGASTQGVPGISPTHREPTNIVPTPTYVPPIFQTNVTASEPAALYSPHVSTPTGVGPSSIEANASTNQSQLSNVTQTRAEPGYPDQPFLTASPLNPDQQPSQFSPTPASPPPRRSLTSPTGYNSLPIFPSVPSAPLPQPRHAPVEQKEAMLISFD